LSQKPQTDLRSIAFLEAPAEAEEPQTYGPSVGESLKANPAGDKGADLTPHWLRIVAIAIARRWASGGRFGEAPYAGRPGTPRAGTFQRSAAQAETEIASRATGSTASDPFANRMIGIGR
jgi:hypothetical protein